MQGPHKKKCREDTSRATPNVLDAYMVSTLRVRAIAATGRAAICRPLLIRLADNVICWLRRSA